MRHDTPQPILLKDYSAPDFLAKKVQLRFELDEDETLVTSTVQYQRNPKGRGTQGDLVLDGKGLKLVSVHLNGEKQDLSKLTYTEDGLTIPTPPDQFSLQVVTALRPQDNTALEGLYKSQGKFCTQCEPEGFRRITYFLDRPDVMAEYETTIIAEKKQFPILLSNGNLIASGMTDDKRHFATWHDPFPKPCYLFALVAGALTCIEDFYVTKSGRKVTLRIFVEEWNAQKCDHAMRSVKAAMKWDEDVYGLEYDLDIFMIVAASDFNMGAMENKGLNIFNARYVLADPQTATDTDFENILGVVGHEYFHNWTGNRVTCRDWFQLCLKEGLTVFRDQEFSADLTSRDVVRIDQVARLRTGQFPEDASPLAHPIRPETYIEINNFYTATVYEKGAEVIRMLHTILGPERFRKGMDLYFKRHDGQAVTTEDFVAAMADASGVDLSQFARWYSQAGTPVVEVSEHYEQKTQKYTLKFKQSIPDTPGQKNKKPHVIPIRASLLDEKGNAFPIEQPGAKKAPEQVLLVTEAEQEFTFKDIPHRPVPSLLRSFSAPVYLKLTQSDNDLNFIMSHDTDGFNRYEAAQKLAIKTIEALCANPQEKDALETFSRSFGRVLADQKVNPRLKAQAMTLPGLEYLVNIQPKGSNIDQLFGALRTLSQKLSTDHRQALLDAFMANQQREYDLSPLSVGKRNLKNISLRYLLETENQESIDLATKQYLQAGNMTDMIAALSSLMHLSIPERQELLQDFYKRWHQDPLVLDKWFTIQAGSRHPQVLHHVKALLQHPNFDPLNPNRVYSLFGPFARGNPLGFHHKSGEGYKLLADFVIRLDPKNALVASRILNPLARFRQYDSQRSEQMKKELQRIVKIPGISKDVYEIASKGLNG